ncbi:epoxide hydrolase 1-like [Physella acuta]|uniref:epoxide hydrolase 1-like n=1 Tax=Physella acuta TaxID=109671 RepID=UPI0027DD0872|nr:epoxide hydrolase 1-like [Physella acuta]
MAKLFDQIMLWVVALTQGLWGIKLHYVASGPEGKPLMLFIHGFPEFWFSWRHQIKEFQKDYRVVAIDTRGCGESEKPSKLTEYSMAILLSDIKRTIVALGYKSCVLVAHDWGGAISWAFCRHHPDMVDKFIVMNAPPLPVFEKMIKLKEQFKMSWYMFFFQLPYLPELYIRMKNFEALESCYGIKKTGGLCFSGAFHKPLTQEELDAYKYIFSQPGTLTASINYYRAILGKPTEPYDMTFTMPILVIWGCDDKALHVTAVDDIKRALPQVSIERIEEAGHFVQMDTPEKVNRAMRAWLNRQA